MTEHEKWIRWVPILGSSNSYFISSICSNENGELKIILSEVSNHNRKICVAFNEGVFAYRETDETYVDSRMLQACKRQGRELFFGTNFFKVLNSDYVKWLSQQSGGISDYEPLDHFAIFTEESLIEILANYEPDIKFVNDK